MGAMGSVHESEESERREEENDVWWTGTQNTRSISESEETNHSQSTNDVSDDTKASQDAKAECDRYANKEEEWLKREAELMKTVNSLTQQCEKQIEELSQLRDESDKLKNVAVKCKEVEDLNETLVLKVVQLERDLRIERQDSEKVRSDLQTVRDNLLSEESRCCDLSAMLDALRTDKHYRAGNCVETETQTNSECFQSVCIQTDDPQLSSAFADDNMDPLKEQVNSLLLENEELRRDINQVSHSLTESENKYCKTDTYAKRLEEQVSSQKEVISITKQMLDIRNSEVSQLKSDIEKVSEIVQQEKENRSKLVYRVDSTEKINVDLKREYEKQLHNIHALKGMYEERMNRLAAENKKLREELRSKTEEYELDHRRCTELQTQTHDLENLLSEQEAVVKNLQTQLTASVEESKTSSGQLTMLNNLFSELGKTEMDFDKLKLLQDAAENISEMRQGGVELQQIAASLPKVWHILVDLMNDNSPSETVEGAESCYKSVNTPHGPRLVISVSKTFIKLKDLILEKKSLQKDLTKIRDLNGQLESKLHQQERRLSLVSTELKKTWGLVEKMRAQHEHLHTSEKILRYELQQKRKLLNELKEELEYCREKWEQARQKNSKTEQEWRSLREEFAARKQQSSTEMMSGESGFSDDRGDDESSSCDEVEPKEDEDENRNNIQPCPVEEPYIADHPQSSPSPESPLSIHSPASPHYSRTPDSLPSTQSPASSLSPSAPCSPAPAQDVQFPPYTECESPVPAASQESNETGASEPTEGAAGGRSTPGVEEILDARAERLKRLEEQCKLLFKKVVKTTTKSVVLSNRLEELHEQYGSSDGETAEPSERVPSSHNEPLGSSENAECDSRVGEEPVRTRNKLQRDRSVSHHNSECDRASTVQELSQVSSSNTELSSVSGHQDDSHQSVIQSSDDLHSVPPAPPLPATIPATRLPAVIQLSDDLHSAPPAPPLPASIPAVRLPAVIQSSDDLHSVPSAPPLPATIPAVRLPAVIQSLDDLQTVPQAPPLPATIPAARLPAVIQLSDDLNSVPPAPPLPVSIPAVRLPAVIQSSDNLHSVPSAPPLPAAIPAARLPAIIQSSDNLHSDTPAPPLPVERIPIVIQPSEGHSVPPVPPLPATIPAARLPAAIQSSDNIHSVPQAPPLSELIPTVRLSTVLQQLEPETNIPIPPPLPSVIPAHRLPSSISSSENQTNHTICPSPPSLPSVLPSFRLPIIIDACDSEASLLSPSSSPPPLTSPSIVSREHIYDVSDDSCSETDDDRPNVIEPSLPSHVSVLLHQFPKRLDIMKQEKQALEQQLVEAEESVSKLLHEVSTAERNLKAEQDTKDELQKTLNDAEARIKMLQMEHSVEDTERVLELKKMIEQLEIRSKELESREEELKQKLIDAKMQECRCACMEDKCLSEEQVPLSSENCDTKNLSRRSTDVGTLALQLSEQEAQINELIEKLDVLNEEYEEEKTNVVILRNQLQDALEKSRSRDEENLCLQDEVQKLSTQNEMQQEVERELQSDLETEIKRNEKQLESLMQLQKDMEQLQETVVRLTKEKDSLWKKNHELLHLCKLQTQERWLEDKETEKCMGCQVQFSLIVRRHHCRLCGRIFCGACSSHWVSLSSSNRKSRSCSECYMAHANVEFGHIETASAAAESDSLSIRSTLTLSRSPTPLENFSVTQNISEEVVPAMEASQLDIPESNEGDADGDEEDFSVISEEEVILAQCSPYAPNPDVLQRWKACEIQSGITITIADISSAAEKSETVWIRAGSIYTVPILVEGTFADVIWEFTTEPKSIAFGIIYKKDAEVATVHSKILVPTTRVNSHIHSIRGKIKVSRNGLYILMFDNSFSKFTGKKVTFSLKAEQQRASMDRSERSSVEPETENKTEIKEIDEG